MLNDLGYEVIIQPALWAILAVAVIILFFRSFYREPIEVDDITIRKLRLNRGGLTRTGIVAIAGILIISSIVIVPPGHRGVIYTPTGVNLTERGEGYHLIPPLVYNASMVSVREQKYENLEVYAQTKDGLEVTTQVGVNYLIVPDRAANIFRDVGQSYEATIIEPAVLGLVKREIGLIEAEHLFFQRGLVEEAIFDALDTRLGSVGIQVTFVALQDTIFDQAIVDRFLAKEAARQMIVEEERLELASRHTANRTLTLADGEARAQERVAEAEEYERTLLEMSPEQYLWYKVWNGVVPQFVSGEGSQFIFDGLKGSPSSD